MINETTHIHYTFQTTLVRFIENMMLPSHLTMKAEVEFIEEDNIDFALQKIEYWLDNFVAKAVVFCANNATAMDSLLDEQKAPRLQNYLMVTPEEPTDDVLAMIFQSKLQALANGAMAIGMIEVTSDNSAGLGFTYVGDGEDELPAMDEWIMGANWFSVPWWCRNDASMIDTMAPEGADLSVAPGWAMDLEFLRKGESNAPEALIIKANFKPKIIDGGTPEE
jgi:hypothetical protein